LAQHRAVCPVSGRRIRGEAGPTVTQRRPRVWAASVANLEAGQRFRRSDAYWIRPCFELGGEPDERRDCRAYGLDRPGPGRDLFEVHLPSAATPLTGCHDKKRSADKDKSPVSGSYPSAHRSESMTPRNPKLSASRRGVWAASSPVFSRAGSSPPRTGLTPLWRRSRNPSTSPHSCSHRASGSARSAGAWVVGVAPQMPLTVEANSS
jgi:hypothetical protein